MRLLDLQLWYETSGRALVWRRDHPNPYEVWISEVMSQQSVLSTVQKYFANWMQKFPTLASLALATEASVLEAWAGLGYYSRARLVHRAAQQLHTGQLGGKLWPQGFEEWREIPGVGPYTAKALAAITQGQPVIPLDGNVIRVVARFFAIRDPLNQVSDLKAVQAKVADLERQLAADVALVPGKVAQAFMDLGATVCRPKGSAVCAACPFFGRGCQAAELKQVSEIPQTKQRRAPVVLDYVAWPSLDEQGRLWVEPVAASAPGNLLGQWEIPLLPIDDQSPYWSRAVRVRHAITHHRFRVRFAEAGRSLGDGPVGRWVDPENPEVHLTTLSRKILLSFFS